MRLLLHHNVPRFIGHIKQFGGVKLEEWEWLQCSDNLSPENPEGVIARADSYLLYPKNEETFKQGLFVLVKAIAIMSFVPGGIHIFGFHFSSEIDDFVLVEESYGSSKT